MNRRNMLLPPMRQRIARASSGDALEETAMTLSDDLNKLDELRARGALTEEEFARAKERLLSAGNTGSGPPPPFVSAVNTFRRSRSDRWIAGVCGGIGPMNGMESLVWRLFFYGAFLVARPRPLGCF